VTGPQPERKLLAALVLRAERVAEGLDEALQLLGRGVPKTAEELAALDIVQRTAATAMLKRVEQLQDLLARIFRTSLGQLGADTSDWYARDFANRMERDGVLDNASAWMDLVRLRNRLVHEYPVSRTEQLLRLQEAAGARDLLVGTLERSLAFLRRNQLLGVGGNAGEP